jgi:biopolymer transport protein ExbD
MAIIAKNKRDTNFAMSGMTDIVFLLLIFFMIVSTLVTPGTANVLLPQSNNQTAANPDVHVTITPEREFYINGEIISFNELESSLQTILGAPEEPPTVRLNADENLDMAEVFDFLAIAKRNKYKVILGTRPI